MHRVKHPTMRASLLLALCALAAPAVHADERSLDGINFPGPLITPNPAGLPQGNWYIEPYLVRVDSRDHYDDNGDRRRSAERSGAWATVVPIVYGFSDRCTQQWFPRWRHHRTVAVPAAGAERRWHPPGRLGRAGTALQHRQP
ncbi:hypothetical protein G6F40_014489 [Rhizopus arrhizus]|nr:hypothetical protein G6F40_014489 [Rhizopus arrhizus]